MMKYFFNLKSISQGKMGVHEIKKKLNDLMKKNNQKCKEILLFLHGVYKSC